MIYLLVLICINIIIYREQNNNATTQAFAIHSPETQKSIFVPCEHFGVLQKHTVTHEKSKDMGDSYCWGYSRWDLKWAWECFQVHWNGLAVWFESHTNTVLCHNRKGIQNLAVITFKCNLNSAGGRFFGTYFKKLLDIMSISTLSEPLNILSGNPASESLLLWRYTDLLEGEKRRSQTESEIWVFLFTKRNLFKNYISIFSSFLEIIRFVLKICPFI